MAVPPVNAGATAGGATITGSVQAGAASALTSATSGTAITGLVVTVAGTSLVARKIEINDDAPGGEFEIEGSVGGLHGTCPTVSFKVNGYQVRTSAATTFESVTCSALKSGDKVEVKGESQADNSVIAKSVKKK